MGARPQLFRSYWAAGQPQLQGLRLVAGGTRASVDVRFNVGGLYPGESCRGPPKALTATQRSGWGGDH